MNSQDPTFWFLSKHVQNPCLSELIVDNEKKEQEST
jgi:hypothetical protein